MEKTRKVVLTNSGWFRGENFSQLLRKDGRMCCLGFDAIACGIPREFILDVNYPSGVQDARYGVDPDGNIELYRNRWESAVEFHPDDVTKPEFPADSSVLQYAVAWINDNTEIDDETRVARLKVLFGRVGIELEYDPNS